MEENKSKTETGKSLSGVLYILIPFRGVCPSVLDSKALPPEPSHGFMRDRSIGPLWAVSALWYGHVLRNHKNWLQEGRKLGVHTDGGCRVRGWFRSPSSGTSPQPAFTSLQKIHSLEKRAVYSAVVC